METLLEPITKGSDTVYKFLIANQDKIQGFFQQISDTALTLLNKAGEALLAVAPAVGQITGALLEMAEAIAQLGVETFIGSLTDLETRSIKSQLNLPISLLIPLLDK